MQENKKCSIIITYLLLENESDPLHCLTQTQLSDTITRMGCPCDRKTIGRDIKALIQMGYPIRRTPHGFYMDKKAITVDEAKFVVRCVKETAGEEIDTDALIPRLIRALGHSYLDIK